MPRLPRLLGLGYAPRICMTELMTPRGAGARRSHSRLIGAPASQGCFSAPMLRLGQRAGEHTHSSARLARLLLQGMVDVDRRGEVAFSVPFTRLDLRGPAFE